MKETLIKPRRGLTLMEVLVATFITVIIFGSLLSLNNYTAELQEMSRNRITAINAARQMLEQIKLDIKQQPSFPDVIATYSGASGNFTPLGFVAGRASGRVYTTLVANSDNNLYDVSIVVCWRQKNGRVIGEDKNLNGVLDAGEDANGNGRLDSPCILTSALRDTKGL